jgi:hypothetical protein
VGLAGDGGANVAAVPVALDQALMCLTFNHLRLTAQETGAEDGGKADGVRDDEEDSDASRR